MKSILEFISIVTAFGGIIIFIGRIIDAVNLEAIELRLLKPSKKMFVFFVNNALLSLFFTPLFIYTVGSDIHNSIFTELKQEVTTLLIVQYTAYWFFSYTVTFIFTFIHFLALVLILDLGIIPVYSYSVEIGEKENKKNWYILKASDKKLFLLADTANHNKSDAKYLLLSEKEILNKPIQKQLIEGKDRWFWYYRNLNKKWNERYQKRESDPSI